MINVKKYFVLIIACHTSAYSCNMSTKQVDKQKSAECKEVTEQAINFLVKHSDKIINQVQAGGIAKQEEHELMQKLLDVNIKLKNDLPKCKTLTQETREALLHGCSEVLQAYKYHVSATSNRTETAKTLCSSLSLKQHITKGETVLSRLFELLRHNKTIAQYNERRKQEDIIADIKILAEDSTKIDDFRKKAGLKELTQKDWLAIYQKTQDKVKMPLITFISWGELPAVCSSLAHRKTNQSDSILTVGIVTMPFEKRQRNFICSQLTNAEFINSDALPFICFVENSKKTDELVKKYGDIIHLIPHKNTYHFLEYLMAYKEQGNKDQFIGLRGKDDTMLEDFNLPDISEFYKKYDSYQTKLKETIGTELNQHLIPDLIPIICGYLNHEVQ